MLLIPQALVQRGPPSLNPRKHQSQGSTWSSSSSSCTQLDASKMPFLYLLVEKQHLVDFVSILQALSLAFLNCPISSALLI